MFIRHCAPTVSQTAPEHATTCGPGLTAGQISAYSPAPSKKSMTARPARSGVTGADHGLTCRIPVLRGIYDQAAPRAGRAERRIRIVKSRAASITERDAEGGDPWRLPKRARPSGHRRHRSPRADRPVLHARDDIIRGGAPLPDAKQVPGLILDCRHPPVALWDGGRMIVPPMAVTLSRVSSTDSTCT